MIIEYMCPCCFSKAAVPSDTGGEYILCGSCGSEMYVNSVENCPQCHETVVNDACIADHGMCYECHHRWQMGE